MVAVRKSLIALLILLLALPIAFTAAQPPPLTLEISGINPQAFPTVLLTADVYDRLGQPLRGLSESSFTLTGDLSATTRITRVENITDDNLPFGAVLVIDVSSSMAGLPLERAKTAAQAFIDSLRPDDPVALMTFGSDVQLVQDFTTDRTALSASIAALQWGGQTALYQAAFEAINVAANARLPRRAVVLLSDGAEFGDLSQVGRSAALTESTVRGVPLYTIGLGYGIDRSYLIELSEGTNAQFYESPSPDQLVGIYQELAARFRSQYILTLETTIPGDGTTYILGLTANSAEGSASAEAAFRAPIPVPIVRILDAPAGEVAEPASLTIEVLADDPLATVAVNDGSSEMILVDFASPYSISIDPMAYEPGMQTFTVSARDDDGDVGTAQVNVWIAAPTATPITPTATPTSTATPSATPTLTHTPTPTLTPTPMPSATNTPTPMPVVEDTPAPTETVVAVAQVASPQPSNTPRPTLTITVTPDLRATANALATLNAATAESQAVQTASAATQSAQAQQATAVAATQAAQFVQTAVAQTEVAATQSAQLAATVIAQTQIAATQAAQLAQTAAAQTQSAATVIAQVTRTAIASATQAAATLAAQLTATAAQQATQTAIVEATQDAIALATGEARATQLAGVQATQTAGVQATADARASAVATVPAAPTRTPTMTPVPPLREITTENPPTVADLLPLLCLAGVVALVLVVVFVLMGGRRRQRK
jgi:VWFA-related protein